MIQKRRYLTLIIAILLLIITPTNDVSAQKMSLPMPSEGFSPNNDGNNDFWFIKNIEEYAKNEVYIYNRWGTQIANMVNYDNKNNYFEGLVQDKITGNTIKLPFGTYFYIIKIPNEESMKGFFILAR